MTNGEKHIEKLLSWYKEAVTEDGVCYLTSDDKNTLAYALKCCKHFEDIKEDIDSWMLREKLSSSKKPNKSENPTSSDCVDRHSVDLLAYRYLKEATDNHVAFYEDFLDLPPVTPIRPKGHWYIDERPESNREVICSNCEQPIFRYHELYFDYRPKYCPNCGADMRGEE